GGEIEQSQGVVKIEAADRRGDWPGVADKKFDGGRRCIVHFDAKLILAGGGARRAVICDSLHIESDVTGRRAARREANCECQCPTKTPFFWACVPSLTRVPPLPLRIHLVPSFEDIRAPLGPVPTRSDWIDDRGF